VTGRLDLDDFRWGLRNAGIILSNEELLCIFNAFDKEKVGAIPYNDFLFFLKEDVNERRGSLI